MVIHSILFYFILLSPIFSLFSSIILSRNSSKNQLILINLIGIFFSFFCSLCLLSLFILTESIFFEEVFGIWFETSIISIEWGFLCDTLSIFMLFVVSLISSLVHLYSISYMRLDPNLIKFIQYLTLFTLAMYILITSNNLIQMFIGWEGVGVCSFLLINFWDSRIAANTSAIKAIIVNRIGDLGLIIAFILIFRLFGIFDYLNLFTLLNFLSLELINDYFYLISFFLFVGAVGKSAQLFLHVWLPDAMEGPTPVSALIHAATMVTAGVFLIIRCGTFFELLPGLKKIILIIGGITALFAGSTGMVQNDLKKVIAYSTCSQLGFMFVACGLGLYEVALFHLSMHAFFKALLFLSAGSIIHAFASDEQDIRRLGGLYKVLPVTYIALVIGSLALMGFPFTAGYYSKDLILEALFSSNCPISRFALLTCLLATICTIFYSTRLLYLIFFTKVQQIKVIVNKSHESDLFMLIPLIVLSFFSLFGGYLFKEIFVGLSIEINNYLIFYRSLSNNFYSLNLYYKIEELNIMYKLIPFFLIFSVSFITFYLYYTHKKFQNSKIFRIIFKFLIKKWYFDIFYAFISKKVLNLSFNIFFILGDRGFLELFGPLGIVRGIKNYLKRIRYISSNNIFDFIFNLVSIFLIFLIFLICALNFI
jgi:NADH-quinone oxidoreductase subunit L